MSRYLSFVGICFAFFSISLSAYGISGWQDVWNVDGESWQRLDVEEGLQRDFEEENHLLSGKFSDHKVWKSMCRRSYWDYAVDLQAHLSTIDFELNEDGTIDVYADLFDLRADLAGTVKRAATACWRMKGAYSGSMDRAELFAKIHFEGKTGDMKDIRVQVISTRLGTLHLAKWMPGWMDRMITRTVNRVLAKLWRSRLGAWISDKITDIIKDKIPVEQE